LRGYAFLSLKPALIVINKGESAAAPALKIDQPNVALTQINAKLESELFELSEEDAALFMQEFGIAELGRRTVIRLAYALLNVLSFFTVGEDEVRAWTLHQGASALDAAAAIHTDLAKGFIRAEVIGYQELLDLGGMREAKAKGRLRLEGKEYVVRDGEIVHIRHNM
jgi:ribosome-binding ATPase YchF (GTP1/OBG family)